MPNFNCDPNVDTAGLVDLSYGWEGCTSIESFPPKDFNSGLNFNYTWANCSSMATISTLYLYNQLRDATEFVQTWEGCSSLTSFGAYDLSSATVFDRTWKDCSSLTSFPFIFVDSGTTFFRTWEGCTSLTSFPLLTVSSGTNFNMAWADCTSLTSFPLLNVSNGTNFTATWSSCTSLTTFPAGMFDTCTSTFFVAAWVNCALDQTSVDNILVSLDTAGQSNGTVNIDGGTSAAPSATGLAAKASLQSKGWTVTTN